MELSPGQPERRRRFRRAEDSARSWALRHREIRRAAVGLLCVVAAVLAIAVAALAIGAINDRDALRRATAALSSARAAVRQTVVTRQLTAAIGASRRTSILEQCRAQNARHDLTIARLDRGITLALRRTHDHRRRAELRDSRAFTIRLIEALAPRQDCPRLADRDAPVAQATG